MCHLGHREGTAPSIPRTVVSLAGSPRQEVSPELGRSTQGREKPGERHSGKPLISENPGKETMEEHLDTDWGYRHLRKNFQ